MNRRAANRAILDHIYLEIEENPDLRFGQILRNLGIVGEITDEWGSPFAWTNEFNTEPWFILDRILSKKDENAKLQNLP